MYPEHFVSTTWIQSKKNTTFKHAKKYDLLKLKKSEITVLLNKI